MLNHGVTRKSLIAMAIVLTALLGTQPAMAQLSSNSLDGFGLKIFKVESGLYPFVEVYFRTFNQNMRPLVNLNELNIGVMVQGRSYDVSRKQYMVQSIMNREEAVRSILIMDCSKTMKGVPFEASLRAAARFIDSKRRQDQVAILATQDTTEGYEVISNFERDASALARRLADLTPNGMETRLYDTIGAAIQLSGMVSQGGSSTGSAQYIISNSIIVFSDGKDEGSAITRSELNTRITNLTIPIPIYSLAYTKINTDHLKNLQSLSKNSFGIYYPIAQAYDRMQRTVEDIQNILQNDYVVTFRSYLPVQGIAHPVKIGVEYPSRSGQMVYQSATFESIEPPPIQKIIEMQEKLDGVLKRLPDADPYLKSRFTQ